MILTNEEMEALNRATEILSKYVCSGTINQDVFLNFEKMVVAIIDGSVCNCNDSESPEAIFLTEPYLDGVIITKYIGFDDRNIHIPQSINNKRVIALGESAFSKAEEIVTVDIPDGVLCIRDSCFESCVNIERVRFPSTLKAIGNKAFYKTAINSIIIPDSVFYIGEYAFAYSQIENVVLSSSLYTIPEAVFTCCDNLVSVYIPEGIVSIGDNAFSDCNSLTNVSLPNGLLVIDYQAFCNCSALNEVDIPNSVQKIGSEAFSNRYHVSGGQKLPNDKRKQPIKIKCFMGSVAQEYARSQGLLLERSDRVYKSGINKNTPVYIAKTTKPREKSDYVLFDNMKDKMLSVKKYDWVELNSNTVCFRTDDPLVEDFIHRRNTYDSIRIDKII